MEETAKTAVEMEAPEAIKARAELFIKEYGELIAKHGMDFGSYPMFVPDGQGGFKIVVQTVPMDMRNRPQASPFVPSN